MQQRMKTESREEVIRKNKKDRERQGNWNRTLSASSSLGLFFFFNRSSYKNISSLYSGFLLSLCYLLFYSFLPWTIFNPYVRLRLLGVTKHKLCSVHWFCSENERKNGNRSKFSGMMDWSGWTQKCVGKWPAE